MFYIIIYFGKKKISFKSGGIIVDKPFKVTFKLDAIILAILYTCYRYKYPASYMLSFYEMYGRQALYILKVISCDKKSPINDSILLKIIEESRLLYKEIISGITVLKKIESLSYKVKNGVKIDEIIPDKPHIDTNKFSPEFKDFIENYLTKNISDVYSPEVELALDTKDLYYEMA